MLSVLFLVLAGMCNAVMDKIVFHWDDSVFKGSKLDWWANPEVSYKNKWKNNSNSSGGEKFPGSSTVFVWVTDLWHFAQSFMISFFVLAALFYADGIINYFDNNWFNIFIDFIILKSAFSLTFELFWSVILKK
jgi:hypothetical protein|tara:strand:- start:5576 stop:5974 length:399 start_codon:yes stop_codon:yes gene_type:complete